MSFNIQFGLTAIRTTAAALLSLDIRTIQPKRFGEVKTSVNKAKL
jgi:hypothetical protein